MSPTLVRHSSFPVAASTPQTWASRLVMNTLPSAYAAPRFTVSQQATPLANGAVFGTYRHFTAGPGLDRSKAYRAFGQGVTTYIVVPTTIGAASCPRWMPVSKVQTGFRSLAFSGV